MTPKPPFYLLVSGSRDAVSMEHSQAMSRALESIAAKVPPDRWEWHLVHGACPTGADPFCATYARVIGLTTNETTHEFPANWDEHGKKAGPIRNQRMVDFVAGRQRVGDRVGAVAFPGDAQAGGTADCVKRAKLAGLPVHVVPLDVTVQKAARLRRRR